MFTHFRGGIVQNVTYPNGATKTRALNAHAQVRPSSLTTPTGKVWSINRQYYTPTIGGVTYTTNVMGNLIYESINRTFSYTYDGSGNISKITDRQGTNSTEKTYQYDELNQLIRENDPVAGKTTTYTYDNGGNILTKTEYTYTTGTLGTPTNTINYTYGNTEWKDLLTAYNGQNITYDQIGNPLTYYHGTQFTWNYGRKLSNAVLSDGTAISYKYNDSGIRTQKTVGGVTTDYFLDGSKIVAQKTGNNTTWYYYDGDGTREAIEYGGNVYYYFYNAQGDVVGLFDNNLNVVVEYIYDSWGNVLSITGSLANTLGQDNPFRYRGYYFDSDTGLYYLNSRYYDANVGRFINADGVLGVNQDLLGYNLFAYCSNDPINCFDATGNGKIWNWVKDKYNSAVNWAKNKLSNFGSKASSVTNVVETINSEAGTVVGDSIADQVINNIAPKTYAPIKGYQDVAVGTMKNIGIAANNTAYTMLSPYLGSMKAVSKGVGIITLTAFAVDVAIDYQNYGNNPSNFYKAVAIDVVFAGFGLVAAGMLATIGSPVIFAIATVGVGTAIALTADATKRSIIGG